MDEQVSLLWTVRDFVQSEVGSLPEGRESVDAAKARRAATAIRNFMLGFEWEI